MSVDNNPSIFETLHDVTVQVISEDIRDISNAYASHISHIKDILEEINEDYDYDVNDFIGKLSWTREQVSKLRELCEDINNLIDAVDKANKFTQATFPDDEFLKFINKTKENFVDSSLISDQDILIAKIRSWEHDLVGRTEISFEEIKEIFKDILGEFSSIGQDLIDCDYLN